jgi:hypothetical protein
MEGEAALSQVPREKSKGRARWHWERYACVQISEVEEAMVSELSLPKPGGHVLSP